MKALDWLENFYFKYFSSSTASSDDGWVRYLVYGIMFVPFVVGFFFTIMGFMDLARLSGNILLYMLIPFAIIWIVVYLYHNYKLKKLGKKWK